METQAPLEDRLSELITDVNTSQFTEQELMDSLLCKAFSLFRMIHMIYQLMQQLLILLYLEII